MSKLWITELQSMGTDRLGNIVPVPTFPAIANQTPLTLGASQRSAALNAQTKYLQLYCDGLCHYVVATGDSHSATVNDTPLPAGQIFHIGVKPGDKIAAIVGV